MISEYEKGDRVKIVSPRSSFNGLEGTITKRIDSWAAKPFAVEVSLVAHGMLMGNVRFAVDEVKKV